MINHRNLIILSILVGAITILFGQEYKITDFRTPFVKQYGMLMGGNSSFYYNNDYDFDIHPYYKSFSDRMDNSIVCFTQFSYESPGPDYGYIDYSVQPWGQFDRYFWNSPIFISAEGSYHFFRQRTYNLDWLQWETSHSGNLALAMGAGHLRDGSYAIAALKINEILKKEGVIDKNLSRETIVKIVEALAGGSYFVFRHERYQRYLSTIIEDIVTKDEGFQKSIPIFVWFEIFDVVDFSISFNNIKDDFDRWQRFFGSRFVVKFEGEDISKMENSEHRSQFPFLKNIYYRPSLAFNYEYEKPVDIRRQLSLGADYSIDGVDARHAFGPNARFGYGITDRLLVGVGISVIYVFSTADHPPPDYIRLPADVSVIYYIEDHCYVSINFDPELQLIQKYLPDRGYNINTYTMSRIEFNWRIF